MSVSAQCLMDSSASSSFQHDAHACCMHHAAETADAPCLDAPLLRQAAMLHGQCNCICLILKDRRIFFNCVELYLSINQRSKFRVGLLIVCSVLPKLVWCIGYGKQDPETMIDVWVTMFSLLMGTTMWLILGSIITTLLIHLNAAHSEYTAKMTALSQYMMENNLPQVHVYAMQWSSTLLRT